MRRMIGETTPPVKPPKEPRASPPGPAASDAEIAVAAFLAQRARQEMEMRRRMFDEAETTERLAKGWRW